jgi:hypothetical protein
VIDLFDAELVPFDGAGDSAAPSLFKALQEQLGLKMETTKTPLDGLVIDRAERPSGIEAAVARRQPVCVDGGS